MIEILLEGRRRSWTLTPIGSTTLCWPSCGWDCHDGVRAWKSFDWDVMDRLHAKGLIHDPVGKAKSVVLPPEGVARSEPRFQELFAKR
jgi:hypothetical protein